MAALCMVTLSVWVLRRSTRQAVHLAFAFFVAAGAMWAMGVALATHLGVPLRWMVFGGHLAFVGGILGLAGFYVFALIFPAQSVPPEQRRHVAAVYGLGAVLALLATTGAVFQGPEPISLAAGAPRPAYGPLFPVFALAGVGMGIGVIVALVRTFRRAASERERTQLLYLSYSGAFTLAIAMTLVFILPRVGLTRFGPLAPLTMVAFCAATALAVTRHRLFQLGVVFRQVLTASGMAVALTALILLGLALWRVVLGPGAGLTVVGLVASATLAAVVLPTARRAVERAVDFVTFGGPPIDMVALNQLSRDLTTWVRVKPLTDLLVSGVRRALRLQHVAVYLRDTELLDERWVLQATNPSTHPAPPELPAESPLVAMARAKMGPVVVATAAGDRGATVSALQEQQLALAADVVVPLTAEGQTLGLLVLSEKLNGDLLGDAELAVLTTLAHQASTALANALLHEEILRLKVHNDNVLRGMVSGVIAVDQSGYLTTCNRRAAELLGQPASALLGESDRVLPEVLSEPLRDARLSGRQGSLLRADLSRADGSGVVIALRVTVLRDAEGETIGALAVFEDQTERLSLEDGMQRADRLASLGTLAAGLAHEIKNPLVSIRTLAQLLPTKFDDPEFRNSFAQLAAGEVERINDLVERLLLFARPSPPHLQWLHLDEVVDDVLQLLGPEVDAQDVTVIAGPVQPDVWVYADPAQMRQVLLNLLMNALQALEGAPTREVHVLIKAGCDGVAALQPPDHWTQTALADEARPPGCLGMVTVAVSDTGPGIPEELTEAIFDPFFTTKPKGSGLGLAVVARIVREHGGTMTTRSTSAGGACLVVNFPAYVPESLTAPLH